MPRTRALKRQSLSKPKNEDRLFDIAEAKAPLSSSIGQPLRASASSGPVTPLGVLHSTFGFSAFRGVQEQVISRVMAGKHMLAVMPTGAGKSLCYQVPALARQGTASIVSPLIVLMHDQIRTL